MRGYQRVASQPLESPLVREPDQEQDGTDDEGGPRPGVPVALRALYESHDDGTDAGRRQDRSEKIEVRPRSRAGVWHPDQCGDREGDADRDVNHEDRPPSQAERVVRDEPAAEERPDDGGQPGDGTDDPVDRCAFGRRVERLHARQHLGHHQRRRDALQRPRHDEDVRATRHRRHK